MLGYGDYSNHRSKRFSFVSVVITIAIVGVVLFNIIGAFSGFGFWNNLFSKWKGEIVGNTFTIDTFDNYGNLTLKTHGSRIVPLGNLQRDETLSSVITITIDGRELETCGDTCIFYEDGLSPDYDFTVNDINTVANGIMDYTIVAKPVNSIKNYIGKSRVVIIKSQLGTPIYAFSGDNIYWEVCDDLPKFTIINVDGKALYIHRANFQIIDKNLIDDLK